MSCPESQVLMAGILSNKDFTQKLNDLSIEIDNLRLSQSATEGSSRADIIGNTIKVKEAELESLVMLSALKNTKSTAAYVSNLSKSFSNIKDVFNILESAIGVDTYGPVMEAFARVNNYDVSLETIKNGLYNYVANDNYYKSIFRQTKDGEIYQNAQKVLLEDVDAAKARAIATEYLMTNARKVDIVKGLKKAGKIDDGANILTTADIESISDIKDLAKVAQLNPSALEESDELLNAFIAKRDELKASSFLGQNKLKKSESSAFNNLAVISALLSDNNFSTLAVGVKNRAMMLGHKTKFVSLDAFNKISDDLYQYIKEGEGSLEIVLGKDSRTKKLNKMVVANRKEAALILGPEELIRRNGMDVDDAVGTILNDVFEEAPQGMRDQIIWAAYEGNTKEFNRLALEVGAAKIPYAETHYRMMDMMIDRSFDVDKGFVFFDGMGERYGLKEGKLRPEGLEQYDRFTRQHDQNALLLGETNYASKLKDLKKFDGKYIIVPYGQLTKWQELIDFATSNGKTIVMARGGQNRSFGFIKKNDKYYLTARAKNQQVLKELEDSVISIAAPTSSIERVVIDEVAIEPLKDVGLSNVGYTRQQIDYDQAWDIIANPRKTSYQAIINSITDFLVYTGYERSTIELVGVDDDFLRRAFYNWSFAQDIDSKYEWFTVLKDIVGFGGGTKDVNFFQISKIYDTLRADGYGIPLPQLKSGIATFLETGSLPQKFVSAFAVSNNLPVDSASAYLSDLISKESNLFKSYVDADGLTEVPKTGFGDSLIRSADEDVNILRESLANQKGGPAAFIDMGKLDTEYKKILAQHDKEIKKALKAGKTKAEIDLIYEKTYQLIDEFEYSGLDGQLGGLYGDGGKSGSIYGRKFNLGKTYTLDDIATHESFMTSMRNDWKNRLEEFNKKIDLGQKKGSLQLYGYKFVDNAKGRAIVSIDDAIMEELKYIPRASGYDNVRYANREALSRLSLADKGVFYTKIKESNLSFIERNGIERLILEQRSIPLKNSGFFDTNIVVNQGGYKLPKIMFTKTTTASWIDNSTDLILKEEMFKKVSKQVAKNTTNKSQNLFEIAKIVKKETDLIVNTAAANGMEGLDISRLDEIKASIADEYTMPFGMYAELTPVDKSLVKKVKERTGATQVDSMTNYTYKQETNVGEGLVQNVGDDPEVIKFYQESDRLATETAIQKLNSAPKLAEADKELNKSVVNFYGRTVAAKSDATKRIFDTSVGVIDLGAPLSNILDRFISADWLVLNSILNVKGFADVGSYWNLFKGSFNYGYGIQVDKIKEAQQSIPSYMNMSDEQFFILGKEPLSEMDEVAYQVSKYYREIRKGLGTNGQGLGPTSSAEVNDAMHNLYKGFMDIGNFKETDKAKYANQVYNQLRSFKGGLIQGNILKGMNSKSVQVEQWKNIQFTNETDLLSLAGDDTIVTAGKVSINEGYENFNDLMGYNFTKTEYMTMIQGMSGIRNVLPINRFFAGLSSFTGAVADLFLRRIIINVRNVGGNLLSGLQGVPAYINQVFGRRSMIGEDFMSLGGAMRNVLDIQNDVADLYDLFKGPENLINKIAGGEDYDILFDGRNLPPENSFLDKLRKRLIYEYGDEGVTRENFAKLLTVAKDSFNESSFQELLELVGQNGNNATDVLFMGQMKDISVAMAIKNNGYRNFTSVEQFRAWMEFASKDEFDRLMSAIRSTTNRTYGDMAGTNFDGWNQAVNPYTGAKGYATSIMFGIRDMTSYLNGWAQATTRNLLRTMEQSINILVRNGGIFSPGAIDDAADFISRTPEFTATIGTLVDEFHNTIRIMRFDDNTDSQENDFSDLSFEDWVNAWGRVSKYGQALRILGPLRPAWAYFDEAISEDEGRAPAEAAWAAFDRVIMSGLSKYTIYNRFVKDMGEEGVIGAAKKAVREAGAGGISYVIGEYGDNSRLYVPGQINSEYNIVIGGQNDPLTDASYKSTDIFNATVYAEEGFWRRFRDMRIATLFLGDNDRIEGDPKTIIGDTIQSLGNVFGNKSKDIDEGYAALKELPEFQVLMTTGKIPVVSEEDSTSFYYSLIAYNPLMNNMKESEITDLVIQYANEGTILGEYDGKLNNKQGLNRMFEIIGQDNLKKMNDELIKVAAQVSKDSSVRSQYRRDYWLSVFKTVIESAEDDEVFTQLWGGMIETANIFNKVEYSKDVELKKQQERDMYNLYADQLKETNEPGYRNYIEQTLARKFSGINETTGKEFFEEKERDDGSKYFILKGGLKNKIIQNLDIKECLDKNDQACARASLSVLTKGIYADTPTERKAAMAAITWTLGHIDISDNLTQNEKTMMKMEIASNNLPTLLSSDINRDSEQVRSVMKGLVNESFTLEKGLSELLNEHTEGAVDDYNKKSGSGSSATSLSGEGVKLKKISYDDVKSFHTELSNSLDKIRSRKADGEFKSSGSKIIDGYRKRELKKQYPMKINAKTKTPSGFTRGQLKVTKDINRKLKLPKPKLPKLQVIS